MEDEVQAAVSARSVKDTAEVASAGSACDSEGRSA